MDCTERALAQVQNMKSVASRASPTCDVKPGNDGEWYLVGAHADPIEIALVLEVLQALEPNERATLQQLLARALRSVEPVEETAPYSATTASIST